MNIRLFKPSLGQEELDNIKEVFDSAWIGLGPKVSEFEEAWSRYIGVKTSVGVNSATAALHLALAAFRFPEGKKVLVPDITFASTAMAPLYNGLIPVLVDVDPETLSISLEDLGKKYDRDCVAVIPVHMGGHPVPMDRIMDFAGRKKLKVIEDCAHCAGGQYQGKRLGTWGDIGCFSFEEKKCMTTGDGGMICSDDRDLIAPLRAQRWVGIDKDTWKRAKRYTDHLSRDSMHWYYEIRQMGYKYNMNDLSAAIGLAQLKKLDDMNRRRSASIRRYLNGIRGLNRIKPLLPFDPENCVYWLFGVRCEKRDALILLLKSEGIATGVHYMPLSMQPLFRPYDTGCRISKRIWQTFVTLPLHADLTPEEIDFITDALSAFEKRY
ncbi:MAG: DegT/DnrJ/EryC1/StrS family aminotransferase [bacterium]